MGFAALYPSYRPRRYNVTTIIERLAEVDESVVLLDRQLQLARFKRGPDLLAHSSKISRISLIERVRKVTSLHCSRAVENVLFSHVADAISVLVGDN
ncbi:hypothetical protein QMZ05_27255 [Bradyrhizobium sp. INPA03-11B]|uniref:hypothetical protein n=1 Tax=Bradyrhizobium sp. INPA03-11B TaxID=418598 RepID=UPI00338D6181